MPIDGRIVEETAAHRGTCGHQASSKVHEREDSRQNVEHMDERKDVKEGAVGIGGEVNALRAKLLPGNILAKAKDHAKKERKREPSGTFARATRFDEATGGKRAACPFQCAAAGEKEQCIQVQNGG